MKAKAFQTSYFEKSVRGPKLERWLFQSDLVLPLPQHLPTPRASGDIIGVQCFHAWVIFDGMQVFQMVPEEVHSKWHWHYREQEDMVSTIWEIEDSEWMASFSQRHLKNHKHYLLTFLDELVEVVCRDLIFGPGQFDIRAVVSTNARFSTAYLHYAEAQEELGNLEEAAEYYQKYLDSDPCSEAAEYALNCLNAIRIGPAED